MVNCTTQQDEGNVTIDLYNICINNKINSSIFDVFFIPTMVIISISIVLNGVGVLLTCLNRKNTNQNIILFYLSMNEIMIDVFVILRYVVVELRVFFRLGDFTSSLHNFSYPISLPNVHFNTGPVGLCY